MSRRILVVEDQEDNLPSVTCNVGALCYTSRIQTEA
jgi:hypothetical protein